MRMLVVALVLLIWSSETLADQQVFHAVGQDCKPSIKVAVLGRIKMQPVCTTIYLPVDEWPPSSFEERQESYRAQKADRLVPLRPVTAEAAPK